MIKTKILITTDVFTPAINGVVTSVLNLSQQLIHSGHEVRILTLSDSNHSKKINNIYYIKSFQIPIYPDVRGTCNLWDHYIDELVEWQPDIIHSHSEFFTYIFARKIAKRTNVPIIHTYHTMYESYTHYFIKNQVIGKKIVALLTRKILKDVDTIIAPTKKVFDALQLYHVKNNVKIVPTGIELHRFRQQLSQDEKVKLKSQLGIELDRKVLVAVGRLAKEKNEDELIENLLLLINENKKITLLFVGDGPYRSHLEEQVKNLGLNKNVIFAGMIKQQEIFKYYQIGDIFVSASTSETQGLTYIEALASGVPVICRKDSSVEGLIEDYKNGFSYISSEEFVNEVKLVLEDDDLALTFSKNAKRTANYYSVSNFASKIERIYLERVFKTTGELKVENIESTFVNH